MILKSIYVHICVETLHSVFNKTEALIVKLGICKKRKAPYHNIKVIQSIKDMP